MTTSKVVKDLLKNAKPLEIQLTYDHFIAIKLCLKAAILYFKEQTDLTSKEEQFNGDCESAMVAISTILDTMDGMPTLQ